MLDDNPQLDQLLADLAEMTGNLDSEDAWPAAQFDRLAEAGVLGWVIPHALGGSEISAPALTVGYERLSAACLVTTFVLTQRNGACQRIAGCENAELKSELLPRLCLGEQFATVGISHLTTSRQHLRKPVVEARSTDSGYRFDGLVPWVTGAKFADYVVTGGTMSDGKQILAAIPTDAAGVEILEPARLMALNASQTGPVELTGVEIDPRWVVAGPVEQVMKQGKGGGGGSLTTSALALGASAAAIQHLREEAERRPDLTEIVEPLDAERMQISADLHAAARGENMTDAPTLTSESIRQRANSLVLRSSQAYLAASKGAGFVAGHPAGRAVREAMFFLVWSCPQPVLTAALRKFACVLEG